MNVRHTLIAAMALVLTSYAAPSLALASPSLPLGLYQSNSTPASDALGPDKPNWAIQYYNLTGLNTSSLQAAVNAGMTPFVELQSCTTTVTNCDTEIPPGQITGGSYDSTLTTIGTELASLTRSGSPATVIVTFDHEMNGSWYPWGNGGSGGVTVTQWKNMWKHVEQKITGIAPNAQFIFAPNVKVGIAGFDQYWPGSAYVAATGLDGYLRSSSDTWASVFSSSVTDIRALDPNVFFFVTETGVNNADSGYLSQIDDLTSNAKTASAGLFYFDPPGTEWTLTGSGQTRLCSDLGYPPC